MTLIIIVNIEDCFLLIIFVYILLQLVYIFTVDINLSVYLASCVSKCFVQSTVEC